MAEDERERSVSQPKHYTGGECDESQQSDANNYNEEREPAAKKELHYPWTPMIVLMIVTVGQRCVVRCSQALLHRIYSRPSYLPPFTLQLCSSGSASHP